jgi:ABC-type transporter Mla maintaining outer membrane lipid asymmetry permease subunit MlaE
MAQLTPLGLVKILGQVTAIMVIPMVGGVVAGLVIAGTFGGAMLGLGVGTLISAIGIWLLIRAGVRKGYTDGSPPDGA